MTTSPNFAFRFSRRYAAAISLAFVVLVPSQSAFAERPGANAPAEFRIDLRAKSAADLNREIAVAARRVCEEAVARSPLTPRDLTRCQKETQARAIAQINQPPTVLANREQPWIRRPSRDGGA